jgi:RNA-directed DNA polymerase
MDAATWACAPSGVTWNGINWAEVQRQVRGLQARIVKATQVGKHNKVKALQWLLTHSFSGKALAVKRVTENKGKNTPGVDKVTWKTPEAKINAIASMKRRGYSPLPLRRVLIPKKNGKTRPLGIPAMKCRAMQALHLLALEPIAETTADLNSYGFRPERSTADAGAQCFIALAKKASTEWVLEADNKLLRSPFAYPRGKPRGITSQKDKTGELRLRSKPKKALTPWQATGNKFQSRCCPRKQTHLDGHHQLMLCLAG